MTNPLSPQIGDVRAQIDAIDSDIAALIARRCGLSTAVGAAKRASGDQAFGWRPAREVEILRMVMRQQASLDPELAFCIWRSLISANLAAQGNLSVHAIEATASDARLAFSVGVVPILQSEVRDVLKAVAKDDHAIGILPWPDANDWWLNLREPEFEALYVCGATPIAGRDPSALLVAKRLPEPAGDDIALIAGPIGAIEGGVLARSGDFELVALGEFISPEAILPLDCRLIGSFALA